MKVDKSMNFWRGHQLFVLVQDKSYAVDSIGILHSFKMLNPTTFCLNLETLDEFDWVRVFKYCLILINSSLLEDMLILHPYMFCHYFSGLHIHALASVLIRGIQFHLHFNSISTVSELLKLEVSFFWNWFLLLIIFATY